MTLQKRRRSNLYRLPLVFILMGLIGCATTSPQPSVVVMRNGTDQVLAHFRVQEVTDSPLDARRFGHFTSVPPHSNQMIARRKNPPPLPSNAEVIWQTRRGQEHHQPIDLDLAVRKANIPGGILVIEVLPNHTAHAYVTPRPE